MRFRRSSALVVARALLACTLPCFVSLEAQALGISGGGFDQALGCSTVACGSSQTLELDPSGDPVASVVGTIDLDSGALTLSFSLSALELSLTPVGGGSDNGVSKVVFTNTDYQASGLSLLAMGGQYIVGPGQTAQVSGTQAQLAGLTPVGGTPSAFLVDARVTGSCTASGGGLSCGLAFGQSGFSFDVGDPSAEARYFQHTANLVAVPEPGTATLLGLSLLAGVAATRRRRAA